MQIAAAAAMAATAAIIPASLLKIARPKSSGSAARGRAGGRAQQQADQEANAQGGARGGERTFLDPLGDILLRLVDLLPGGVGIGARLGAQLFDAFTHRALDAPGRLGE